MVILLHISKQTNEFSLKIIGKKTVFIFGLVPYLQSTFKCFWFCAPTHVDFKIKAYSEISLGGGGEGGAARPNFFARPLPQIIEMLKFGKGLNSFAYFSLFSPFRLFSFIFSLLIFSSYNFFWGGHVPPLPPHPCIRPCPWRGGGVEGGGGRVCNSASSLKKTQFKHICILYKNDQIAN